MSKTIESAVLHAAEAALAHMVKTTKMDGSKIISEGVLYETVNHTLQARGDGWVSHEYPVKLRRAGASPGKAGDHKRVDFAALVDEKVVLIEVKIASRKSLKRTVNVTGDMEKLCSALPLNANAKPISKKSFLIVFNMATKDTHGEKGGWIVWDGKPDESAVKLIGRYLYKSHGFVRTAAVFKITQ
jgi:hypothetical protein